VHDDVGILDVDEDLARIRDVVEERREELLRRHEEHVGNRRLPGTGIPAGTIKVSDRSPRGNHVA